MRGKIKNVSKRRIKSIICYCLILAMAVGIIPAKWRSVCADPDESANPQLKLHKTSSETGADVEGAFYGIYKNPECSADDLIEGGRTGNDGYAVFQTYIKPGETYYVKEISAANNYELDDTVYTISREVSEINIDPDTAVGSKVYNNDASHSPYYAFDGDTSTFFDGMNYPVESGDNGVPAPQLPEKTAWVMAELPGEYEIESIKLYPRVMKNNNGARMAELKIQIATDKGDVTTGENGDWETILDLGEYFNSYPDLLTALQSNANRWFEFDRDDLTMDDGRSAKYIRLVSKVNMHCNIGEVKVFGTKKNAAYDENGNEITITDGYINLEVTDDPIPPEKGTLVVTVTEETSGNPVPGAKVTVDGTEYTTDENGKVTLTDIPAGDYDVVVTEVPEGYDVKTGKTGTVTVPEGGEGTHEAVIATKLGGLIITVMDESKNDAGVAGIDVEITKPDGSKVTLTTDENGQITDFAQKDTYGNYTSATGEYKYSIVENTVPDGYTVTVNSTNSGTVTAGNLTELESKIDLERGTLVVTVTEETSGNPVPGAKVTVDGTEYTTDENGKVTLTDIPAGDYDVVVTEVPEGYDVKTGKTGTVTVPEGGEGTHEAVIATKLGGLIITVMDESKNDAGVAGIDVEITKPDGSKVTLTTDENGQITDFAQKDTYGNYTSATGEYKYSIVENTVPDGYTVTVNSTNSGTVTAGKLTELESKINPEETKATTETTETTESSETTETTETTEASETTEITETLETSEAIKITETSETGINDVDDVTEEVAPDAKVIPPTDSAEDQQTDGVVDRKTDSVVDADGSNVVKTDDPVNVMGIMITMFISLAGLAVLGYKKRKNINR